MEELEVHTLNIDYAERIADLYARNPGEVPEGFRKLFEQLGEIPRSGPSFRTRGIFEASREKAAKESDLFTANLQDRVDQLIRAYRVRGHLIANLDPLGRPRPHQIELEPSFYGFTHEDMDRVFSTRTIFPHQTLTLRAILEHLKNTYCRTIGVQFMHIDDLGIKTWLQERMEGTENRCYLTRAEQLRILTRLTDAVLFEEFIQKKYIGAKSFSLEGAETLIPLLDLAIERAGEQHIDEIVIGMAHRGRLNVLANILGKSPRRIFQEFEDRDPEVFMGHGDVKYHLGHSTTWKTATGYDVHISLCFNPSHLEFVNPVALGRMRAKMDRAGDVERRRGLVILIHGDAAFAGEGIVQETLNLSQLRGYSVGGVLHIVVNNQIGFTTDPEDARSSQYATDVAKMLQIPIFHVNGEDPEGVAQVVRLAMDFRARYKRDVVIDLFCYRRHGHNETDEPEFTQPLMVKAIRTKKPVRQAYLERLVALGEVSVEEAEEIAVRRREMFEAELQVARREPLKKPGPPSGLWAGYIGGLEDQVAEVETGVSRETLSNLLMALTRVPEDFKVHPKLARFLEQRAAMARGERPIDWATAEALAFATLAVQGHRVRLSGQDSERGTFSQRHAVLHDIESGRTYEPLNHLSPSQAPVEIYNSPLSEAGVLGFEYGYSLDYPEALVLWEAQYGDFVNVAQVYVDQFIASAEVKWSRLSGLVLLLPHGLEGQGPEHSSARLERFLALFAQDNMQIVMPTTPAQYFHVLRRQVLRPWRKPLIVFTPKSLLRHPKCVASLDELSRGRFQRIIPDDKFGERNARLVLLCYGKIFYDLLEYRTDKRRDDVAIVRIEQFEPLKDEVLQEALSCYSEGTLVRFVQEEPENMGGACWLRRRFGRDSLFGKFPLQLVARPASPSPATGSLASHRAEQAALVEKAFS